MQAVPELVIGKKYVTDDLEYIALYVPNHGLVSIVKTNNNKYVDPSKLESLVQNYHEKEALRKGVNSINEFNFLMKQYVSSGEKNTLDKFLTDNGYSASEILEGREASNLIEEAVAYTDTKNMLGVYLNFNKAIEKMAQQGKISEKIAKYIATTHELVHTAQGKETDLESIVGKNPEEEYKFRLNIEYEAEKLVLALLNYKFNIALKEKKLNEALDYDKAINYLNKRTLAIERLARMKNISLDKKEYLDNIVQKYQGRIQ